MKLTQVILFLLFSQIGNSQFVECKYSWAKSYEVTAKSGLKLRNGQNTESEVIGLIPYKSEIKLCYESTKSEVIEGIKGKWVKAFWQDKEGFVFDGFTKEIIESPPFEVFSTERDLVNKWKNSGIPNNENYVGLYALKNSNSFELRKVNLRPDEIPIWVFKGLNIIETKKIRGNIVNRMLFIGDKQGIDYGVIYGDGEAIKGDSTFRGVFKEINPYELRIQTQIKEEIIDQLLVKMRCFGGMAEQYGYEAKAVVNFIGDLDGDNKDDILITYQTTYKGWYYGLFSTKFATGNKIFAEFKIGQGSE